MRALRRGDRGREVVDLQTRLLALGLDLGNRGMDGVFGPQTELAVKAFQQSMGILADGVVGQITWNEIDEAGHKPGGRLIYVRQPPFRGADVTELQRMLNDLGFDPGAVNGLFDERTARATKEFQRNAGLTPDGAVDDGVFKVLRTYAAQTLGTHQFPDKNGGYFPEDLFSGTIVIDAAHGGRDKGYVCPRTSPTPRWRRWLSLFIMLTIECKGPKARPLSTSAVSATSRTEAAWRRPTFRRASARSWRRSTSVSSVAPTTSFARPISR